MRLEKRSRHDDCRFFVLSIHMDFRKQLSDLEIFQIFKVLQKTLELRTSSSVHSTVANIHPTFMIPAAGSIRRLLQCNGKWSTTYIEVCDILRRSWSRGRQCFWPSCIYFSNYFRYDYDCFKKNIWWWIWKKFSNSYNWCISNVNNRTKFSYHMACIKYLNIGNFFQKPSDFPQE